MPGKDEIRTFLRELLEDKADFALLFGSWAGKGGRISPESDVDCAAFFYPQILSDRSWFDLAERFEYVMGPKLDLVCLNTADIIIASQVVATGEEIFAHSTGRLNTWRAQVMSRYIDFKQSRKIIERNILVRPNDRP